MSEDINTKNGCDQDTFDNRSDFMKIGGTIVTHIPYKLVVFMFFIGMLIFSDLFIDGFLHSIPGAVDGECPTSKGTMIQLLLQSIMLIVMHLMITYEWV